MFKVDKEGFNEYKYSMHMAGVAQLVRASDCGSEGRRFDPGRSPHEVRVFHSSSF
jgi:hypothetical protein